MTQDTIGESEKTHKKTIHTREPRGQPFAGRSPKGCEEQTRQYDKHTQIVNNKKDPQKITKEEPPWNGQ